MAAMTLKFNFRCMIQYYIDQWSNILDTNIDINRSGLPARMFFALKLALSVESTKD